MGTSSARPDDLDGFVQGSRAADDELAINQARVSAAYDEFISGTRWGSFDATSLLGALRQYTYLNEQDARWVAGIAAAFRAAGGDGELSRLPDAAIEASLRAAGLDGNGRTSVTFDSPVAYGFPATTGYADDPVNTASGNFLAGETELPVGGLAGGLTVRRTYNSRSDVVGAFGPGWSSWADARLHAREDGAHYRGPDGQRAVFGRLGDGYGRVIGVDALVHPVGDTLELRWFDGRTWTFDAAGRPVTAADGPGTEIDFRYVGSRLTTMRHRGGRTVTFSWTGDRVTAAVAGDGRRIGYAYRDGVLIGAGDRAYTVDENARITAVTDADGVVEARNEYDADGRVLAQTSPFGRRTRFAYLPGGVTVTAGDGEDGTANTYLHDAHGRMLAVVDGRGGRLSRTYDEWGHPVAVTERDGSIGTVRRDDRGRPVRRTEPGGATFDYRYDDAGRVLSVTASTGAEVRYRYAGAERTPIEVVDAEGGITRLTVTDGLVRQVTDPDGVTLDFAFDSSGDLLSTTDALGNTSRIERDEAGRVIATVTPLGRRTEFRYDDRGRLAERRDPAGGVWRYEYSAAGRITAVTDPAGARRETRYGSHGRVEATADPFGYLSTRRYDRMGNLARLVAVDGAKWDFEYDALSRLTSTTDPGGATWLREYDTTGNLVGAVDPAGTRRAVTIGADGRVTALSDGLTGSAFEYDELGRAVAHTRPDGTAARAGYDRCGRRVEIEQPGGGITRVEYTPAGRIRRATSPGGRVTEFAYDAAGRLTERAGVTFAYDADGALIARDDLSFRYDAGGRLVEVSRSGSGLKRYEYDISGRVVGVGGRRFEYDLAGRLVAAVDALGGRSTYEYHPRGWLASVTDPLGHTTSRDYDAAGRVVRETDPLGRVTRWVYDPAGRLVERVDGAGRAVRWTYDESGRVASLGGVTIVRDALGRPVEVREPGSYVHRLTWDVAGRLTSRTRDALSLKWTYGPDGEQTALELPDGTVAVFLRDDDGRLTGVTHPSTGTLPVLSRPPAPSGSLDAAGQLLAFEGEHYAYDAAGRPSGEFRHDAAGQLVAGFEYDESGRRVREFGGRTFAWDDFGRLSGVDALPVRVDALGDLAEVGDRPILWDGLDPCWDGAYIPPAAVRPDTVPGRDAWGAPASTELSLGYRGELEFAGLTWLRNRAYDPATRSFLSPDPLPPVPGTPYSGNPYHYAGNDPLGHADPLGLRPVTEDELRAYRDDLSRNAWEATTDWVGDNWEYLAAGAMIVGGVALMFTGVGGPAGIALMAASGGLIAGGASAGIQRFSTGEVDWGQVAVDGLVGAAGGGVGGGLAAGLSSSTRLATTNPLARELLINGAESMATGGLERGLTGGDIFNPRALATDLLTGGAAPAPGNRLGATGPDDLVTVYRFHTAADPQTLRPNLTFDPPEYQHFVERGFAGPDGPQRLAQAIEDHATGLTRHSPFVSVTTDHAAAARTTDPQLGTIINGVPGFPDIERAPDLSTFRVPRSSLYSPVNSLSQSEQELLFRGNDLARYQVGSGANPYPRPPTGEVS